MERMTKERFSFTPKQFMHLQLDTFVVFLGIHQGPFRAKNDRFENIKPFLAGYENIALS